VVAGDGLVECVPARSGGHIQVDDEAMTASSKVKPGMLVRAISPGGLRILEVVALAEKCVPDEVSRQLFVDHTPQEALMCPVPCRRGA